MSFGCEYKERCLNNTKCFVCNGQRLLKLPEDKNRQRLQVRAKTATRKRDTLEDCSESWKDLESAVASRISAMPTVKQYNEMREARRQLRSGAIWFMPGDVADTIILAECKERATITVKGEKTISVPKSWLTKIKQEANLVGKYPSFMFRYKDDETIYSINEFDVLCDMVLEIKFLRIENETIRQERDKYFAVIKQQEQEIIRLKEALEKAGVNLNGIF